MAAVTPVLLGLLALWTGSAQASDSREEALSAEVERVRTQVADEIQLYAYDLIDELVYQWIQEPVFDRPTEVVLAGVSVPVGLGTGMQALVENHLNAVLLENPATQVTLVHCPSCTAVVVHSGPEATTVTRGVDSPATLQTLGTTGRHALFIDVEAEGAFLVLRARITRLTPELPIVWSHTLSTSTAAPALLRDSANLKSAEETRREYLAALEGRGSVSVPVRLGVRTYASSRVAGGVTAPPFLWLQSGAEWSATSAEAWTASAMLGYSFFPQAHQGLMGQVRVHRLLTGRVRSRNRPDLYAFLGAAVISVWGPSTAPFQPDPLTADALLTANDLEGPDLRYTFGTMHLGLDARVGGRIGFSVFAEYMPDYQNSRNIGDYGVVIVPIHSLGTEVTAWF